MSLHALATAEIMRRVALLPAEVDDWTARARLNANFTGIHGTQLDALKQWMDVLHERQEAVLKELGQQPAGAVTADFSNVFFKLVREVVGNQGLWHVFRTILALRSDPTVGPAVDAADLVAANCYKPCIERARAWDVVPAKSLREPPLVALEAGESPVTVSRGDKVEHVGLPLRMHRTEKLPIPVVILPFDHLGCAWLWCGIHHEVGHNLDQDLKLSTELAGHADQRLTDDGVPWDRSRLWNKWGEEILADAIGVLLGGAGYAHFAASVFSMLAPTRPALNPDDTHPHEAVRLRLLAAMVKRTGVAAWQPGADALLAAPPVSAPPDDMKWAATGWPKDCDAVAEVYLEKPLAALGGHALRELVGDPAGDAQRTEPLTRHLHTGYQAPPLGTVAAPFQWRLVPVAAQLALVEAQKPAKPAAPPPPPLADAMKGIHDRAMRFLKNIPRPTWLAAPPAQEVAARKEAIRSQAAAIRF